MKFPPAPILALLAFGGACAFAPPTSHSGQGGDPDPTTQSSAGKGGSSGGSRTGGSSAAATASGGVTASGGTVATGSATWGWHRTGGSACDGRHHPIRGHHADRRLGVRGHDDRRPRDRRLDGRGHYRRDRRHHGPGWQHAERWRQCKRRNRWRRAEWRAVARLAVGPPQPATLTISRRPSPAEAAASPPATGTAASHRVGGPPTPTANRPIPAARMALRLSAMTRRARAAAGADTCATGARPGR